MKIKICGLTRPQEAQYLNEFQVDYAGFVFFEKSKRNVSMEQAKEIARCLSPEIKKVAVTVSPDVQMVRQIQEGGFDILQVHRELTEAVLESAEIPVWYAFNIADEQEFLQKQAFLETLPEALSDKIEAIVVDGAEYGSGRPFDWQKSRHLKKIGARKFVLAGGLDAANVAEGIAFYQPDIVDVSSGVEGSFGKEEKRIGQFVQAARTAEKAAID